MKLEKFGSCLLVLVLATVLAFSCSKKDDDDDEATDPGTGTGSGTGTGTGTGGTTTSDNFFYDAALNTIPALETSVSLRLIEEWSFGNVMYEVFDLFQEYVNERDEGKIGLPNIFKSLHQTGSFYEGAKSRCETVEDIEITSPFADQGSGTYNCVLNDEEADSHHGNAIKEVGSKKDAILTWTASSFSELGVVKGSYDETEGDITLDLTGMSTGFSWRLAFSGNEKDKFFESLHMMKYTPSGYKISIVGKGYAEGESKYFLFKIMDSETTELSTAKYFCFSADASETTLQGMSPADGTDLDGVSANCADYKTDVAAMTMYPIDGSKLPSEQADFTGTGTYNILLDLE